VSYPPPGQYWPPPPAPPPRRELPPTLRTALIVIGVVLAVLSVAGALAIVFTGGIKMEPAAVETGESAPPPTPLPPPSSSSPPATASGPIALPDVRNLTGDAARVRLQQAGFTAVTLRSTDGQPVTPENEWVVIDQVPPVGTPVPGTTPITLTMNRAGAPATPPTSAPTSPPTSPPVGPTSAEPTASPPQSQGPDATSPQRGDDPRFATCEEAKARGFGPYVRGIDPEYAWYLDRDGDGKVCESRGPF
jgi:hypothetical protein